MLDKNMVCIPLEEYNRLISLETRVNVVVERVSHDDYTKIEDLLWILDTELSVELAQEMREKAKKKRAEWGCNET